MVLTGCSNSSSQNPIVQNTVGSITTDHYTFSIIQTKGSSILTDENTSYSGTFDIIVQNDQGTETSRRSINQSFGNKDLLFVGPVNLILNDYNNDNLPDIPIGFPEGDSSGEYKYVIFSVGEDDKIFPLPVKGYKEKGFVYTVASSSRNKLIQTFGIGEDGRPGILVGVEKKGGGFEPAKYVWDGKRFAFEKENPFIISKEVLATNTDKYKITIIQTEYKQPLTPDEKGFCVYESMYRGRFDLQIENSSGKVTSRISLNKYFGNEELGCIGIFPLVFKDYNRDGNYDFAIGRPDKDSPDFQYALFSVNAEGIVYNLSAVGYKEDGFIYSAETGAEFPSLDDGETGIEVTLSKLNVYSQGKYLWDGSKFVFSEKASTLSQEKSDRVTKIYKDKRFNFSVEYPVKWTAIMETFIEPTADHNSSPDGGINIYVDGKQNEKIYVFGQVSHIRPAIDGFHREEFTTNSGLKGHLYSDEIDGKRHINLILGEGFHGVHLRISAECYNQNKEQIMVVLKSIKIA